ncbi:enoyl-CoA hydratase-related protein [Pseudonocardia xishanensis]|uniref:Crotonase/enoyl-CoA hydratase family protein n=1 Tax=Pseudonocardia xishanensis TaxID=630995 RepID=A0ABP8RTF0_9PSEU
MSRPSLRLSVDGPVAELALDRPDALNTLTPAFWSEFPSALDEIASTPAVRVLVISSTGRHFTAGMDLAAFGGAAAEPGADRGRHAISRFAHLRALQEIFTRLDRLRIPVLAAVQGGCVGGGVDLVTACDMRYATADAFFVVQETNIAVTADLGTLQRLPGLIAPGLARELVYTGRRMPADEALRAGLVNTVFDDQAALLDGVRGIAAEIAAKSPLAVTGAKAALNHARDFGVEAGLEQVAHWNVSALDSADIAEAIRARGEKREPVFADLPTVQ